MVPLTVTFALLRELWRALVFPLRFLAFLPTGNAWRKRTADALNATPRALDSDAALEEFLARHPRHGTGTPHVFLSAGELSGELHAARLMRAVHNRDQRPRWTCFGGPRMAEAGGNVRFALSGHGIMGLSGVLRSLPFILRAFASYVRLLRQDPPDLVVLVDYPGLHLVMARQARRRNIPVLHYVAPQYWAWAPWRLNRYRKCVDATWTILPFEPAFYESAGVASEYIGHPLLDQIEAQPPDADLVRQAQQRRTLCVMPGSRRGEIETNLPALIGIVRNLRRDDPDLHVVLPHVDERRVPLIREILERENASDEIDFRPGPIGGWLAGARAALVKSGTGSLEACLHGAPTVVFYRMRGPLTRWFYDRYITVPWIAAINLVANERAVPEHCFADDDGWQQVEQSIRDVLADGSVRDEVAAAIARARLRLGEPGATERAARWIERFFARAPEVTR